VIKITFDSDLVGAVKRLERKARAGAIKKAEERASRRTRIAKGKTDPSGASGGPPTAVSRFNTSLRKRKTNSSSQKSSPKF